MKLTKRQLTSLIKEELQNIMQEQWKKDSTIVPGVADYTTSVVANICDALKTVEKEAGGSAIWALNSFIISDRPSDYAVPEFQIQITVHNPK